MEDTLFRKSPVAPTSKYRPPVVVVGLPRSGSSFLSHILSQIEDYYVFDDLYLLDMYSQMRSRGTADGAVLQQLLYWLGWQIRARKRHGVYAIPNVDECEIEAMNASILKAFDFKCPTVFELQEEWLVRLAHRSGARGWGFKMPKAFLRLDELYNAYPNLRVVFLMRQPHDVLASYKHMHSSSQDGDARRYHPMTYAFYWRHAASVLSREREKRPNSTMFLNFSDLTSDPPGAARQLSEFMNVATPTGILLPKSSNTSYKGITSRQGLTGLELRIVNWICGPRMQDLGFAPREGQIRFCDALDLFKISWRFLYFRFLVEPLERRRKIRHIKKHS